LHYMLQIQFTIALGYIRVHISEVILSGVHK
jgi:hypothetical protein